MSPSGSSRRVATQDNDAALGLYCGLGFRQWPPDHPVTE
jgi:hypothetical protein